MTHRYESTHRTPRWVKAFGIIVIILFLVIAVLIFAGIGGPHGPGRHMPADETGAGTPSESGQ